MNYQAFTGDSLTMMYEAVRGALAADDALRGQREEPRFRVRETPDWKTHAADLESEMLNRGCFLKSSIGLKIQENPLSSDDRRSVVALCANAFGDTPIW
jgi:hypothetical protein